jgi:patched 1 protein
MTVRLVDERGVIRPTGFYNYLSAWVSNDALAYSYSEGGLSPSPRTWYHEPDDTELRIPKSAPLQMALMPFQLVALDSTEALTDTVGQIRAICDSFR